MTDRQQPLYTRSTVVPGSTSVVVYDMPPTNSLIKLYTLTLQIIGDVDIHPLLQHAGFTIKGEDKLIIDLPCAELQCKFGEFRNGYPTNFYYKFHLFITICPRESMSCILSGLKRVAIPYEIYFSFSTFIREHS